MEEEDEEVLVVVVVVEEEEVAVDDVVDVGGSEVEAGAATFHRNVPSEDMDAPGVANLIVLAALGDFVFALPTLYPWADAAFFIVLRSRLASSLIAGLVVFFFKEATVFPHLVDFRRSSVMADSGTAAIPRKISSILASLGSTSFALTSAIVYSLSSRAARDVMLCLSPLRLL